jgi:1,4-dihydroxy-2-naphthoyl-CoA hydrolase
MRIWKKDISVEALTQSHVGTTVEHLGIEFLEVGDDFIRARCPVDNRTRQPYGILHGGVSVVLAETLGSCGAHYSAPDGERAVGLDINANHIRSASSGWVIGTARGAPRAQHPGLADRPDQRSGRADLRFAHHNGGAPAPRLSTTGTLQAWTTTRGDKP